jgi:hypothetical protein
MAYENLPLNGNPTGNYLYITIPIRGTDNWDEKLKEGFFNRVVDHDHTPGKGAAIQEAALDNALQTKVAAIAVNTSEIAQNALDISQNAAAILANATNINSNDTDIANLDIRLTTAESDKITATDAQNLIDAGGFLNTTEITTLIQSTSPNNLIELNSSTDVAAIAGTTVKDAIVRVNTNTAISNVVFENCTIGIDQHCTFSGCTFTGCTVRESDNHSVPYSVTFNSSCNLWGVDVYGFGNCNIDSCSVTGLTVSNGSSVNIDSCTSLTKLNITCRTLLIDNQATFSDSLITIFDYLKIDSGTADNQVSFEDSIINTPIIYSDVAYSILVDSDSRINVEDSYTAPVWGTGYHLKIVNDQGDTLIDKNVGNSALLHNPFKIREGQIEEVVASTILELNNSTDVAAISGTTVKNSIVRININGSINNVVFENCIIGIDTPNNGPTFNTCTLTGCSVRASSTSTYITGVFNTCTLQGVEMYGFVSFSITSSSVEGLTFSHGNTLTITSCTTLRKLNVQAAFLFINNECRLYDSILDITQYVRIDTGTADNQVTLNNSVLNTCDMWSDVPYSILVNTESRLSAYHSFTTHSGSGETFYLKIKNDNQNILIDKSVGNSTLLHSPFTIQDGQLVVSNPSNVEVLTAGRGSTTTVDGYTFFDVLSTVNEASYDPNSIISSGQITLAQGNYLITASCELSTAVHIQLKMSITPSGGSKAIVRQHFSPSVATLNEILLVASDGDVLEIECGSQYAATAETNFIIKKIS